MKPNNHLNWKSCFGTCSNTPLVETQGWTWATSKVFRPSQQRPPPAMTWWRWSPLPAPTRPLTRLASFLQMANLKLFTNGCEKIFHLGQLQVQISLRWPSSSPWPLLPSAHLTPIFDFDFNFSKKKFDLHLVDHVLGHFHGSKAIKSVPLQVLLTPICKHHVGKISPIS